MVAINSNPGPDTQDRLRRLFTLLLEHSAKERQAAHGEESSTDNPSPENNHPEDISCNQNLPSPS